MRWQGDESEVITLTDGTRVTLRAVRPEDKELLARGMARLSSRSRSSRFHYARGELTPAELAYLTEVDGMNHFALGAVAEGASEGLGVARFVRLLPGGPCAEAAIAVADEAQGKGLGRALLERLLAAARERGVTRFRAEVQADNAPMLSLLRQAGDVVERSEEPGVIVVELPLPEPTPAPSGGRFAEILRLVAQGLLHVRTRFPHA